MWDLKDGCFIHTLDFSGLCFQVVTYSFLFSSAISEENFKNHYALAVILPIISDRNMSWIREKWKMGFNSSHC